MEMSNKRKRIGLTLKDKRQMLIISKDNPSWSQQAIANEFNKKFCKEVKRNTISQILSSSNKIVGIQSEATKDVKRVRDPKYPDLENALMAWFNQVRTSLQFVCACK